MSTGEQTLGIVLRARAETAEAAQQARNDLKGIADSAKASATQAAAAIAKPIDAMQQGLSNVAQKGRMVFPAIQAAAATAGSAMGPIAGAFGSIFGAMAAGGPVMIAVTAGITALGLAVSYVTGKSQEAAAVQAAYSRSLRDSGIATDELRLAHERFFGKFDTYATATDEQRAAFNYWLATNKRAYVSLVELSDATGVSIDVLRRQQQTLSANDWANYVASLPVAVTAQMAVGDAIAATTPRIATNAVALRDLMNAGIDYQAAFSMSRMPVITAPDIVSGGGSSAEEFGPGNLSASEVSAMQMAQEKARTEAFKQGILDRQAAFIEHTAFLSATYQSAVASFVNADMTGKQRREAIWESFKQNTLSKIGQVTSKYIVEQLAIRNAAVTTGAVQNAVSRQTALAQIGDAIAAGAKWIALMATKVYAFYAGLGPFGIPAAAATVAAMTAAVHAIKFAEGGVVPGQGYTDRVPAMLTPGERVINRDQYRANQGAIEQAIQGGGSSGNVFNVSLSTRGDSTDEFLRLRAMFDTWLVPAFERAVDEGRFRSGYAVRPA